MLSGRELAEHAANNKLKLASSGYKLVEVPKTDEELQKLKLIEENFKQITSFAKVHRQDDRALGNFEPDKNRVKIVKSVKCIQKYFGTMELGELYLQPYEALYLIEMNDLLLYYDEVIVSLEQAYILLGTENNSFDTEKYTAYSWLLRSGYIVQPFELFKDNDNQSQTSMSDDESEDEEEQIWNNLAKNLSFLNRRQASKSTISPRIVEEFEQIKEQFLTSSSGEPPPSKKIRFNPPEPMSESFLDENDVVGYEEIFNQLLIIKEDDTQPDLAQTSFDFNLYSSEKAAQFARTSPGKPDFYVKVIKISESLDVESLQRLVTTAGGVKVMIVIVFDNLSISNYICE